MNEETTLNKDIDKKLDDISSSLNEVGDVIQEIKVLLKNSLNNLVDSEIELKRVQIEKLEEVTRKLKMENNFKSIYDKW